MPPIRYTAPPTVSRFLDSDAFVRAIVGPVGSGKSSGCIVELLRRAIEQRPGPDGIRRTRFAVIRNTYRELKDTTRKTFEQWIPSALGSWSEQDFTFHMKFKDVESEIMFRSLNSPEDAKKLLSLELTGAYVNEAREIPKHIFDVLQTRIGRYPGPLEGGASWCGIWMDTNPWHASHWLGRWFRDVPQTPPELLKEMGLSHWTEYGQLYRQPGGRSAQAENVDKLPGGAAYYARLCVGKDAEWIRVYVDGEDGTSDVGSIFGTLLAQVDQKGGICPFEHPQDQVFTAWDLGFSDSTAIWFFVMVGTTPCVIDFYESRSQPLSHYFDVLDGRGYQYARHWLPHDARAKNLLTGSSVVEAAIARLGAGVVDIAPAHKLEDGITAARNMLEQPVLFHSRCEAGLEALRSYKYEWDEELRTFSKRPLHDWSSHAADAFRYMAVSLRDSGFFAKKAEAPEAKPAAVPVHHSFTLDQLFSLRETDLRRRR